MKKLFFAINLLLVLTLFPHSLWAQLDIASGDKTLTEALFKTSGVIVAKEGDVSWQNNYSSAYGGTCTGIRLGSGGEGFKWEDRFVVIALNDCPGQISFDAYVSTYGTSGVEFYCSESSDNSSWSKIWESTNNSNPNVVKDLSPSTRYIKLCWSGNFSGMFQNITVTKCVPMITVTPSALNFGDVRYTESAELTFTLSYTIVATPLTLSVNDASYTVSLSSIPVAAFTKGDKEITVAFSPLTMGAHNAKTLTIKDANNVTATVTLNATGIKQDPAFSWLTQPFVKQGQALGGPIVSTNSGGTLSLSSDNTSIISVSGGDLVAAGSDGQQAVITASVAATEFYNAASDSRVFTIAGKVPQYIDWKQGFQLLQVGGSNITLTGISRDADTDAETGLPVTYTSDNTGVVSVTGSTLRIVGAGTTTLRAHCAGNSTYGAADEVAVMVIVHPNECAKTQVITVDSDKKLSSGQTFTSSGNKPFNTITVKLEKTTLSAQSTTVTFYDKSGNNLGSQTLTQKTLDGAKSASVSGRAVKVVFGSNSSLKINSLQAFQMSYLEPSATTYSTSVTANKTSEYKGISFDYSNYSFINVTNTNPHVTITDPALSGSDHPFTDGCGEFGSHTVILSINSPTVGTEKDILTFTASDGTQKKCTLNITVQDADVFHFVTLGNWEDKTNWTVNNTGTHPSELPAIYDKVSIEAEAYLASQQSVQGVTITSTGKLSIRPQGGLSVGMGGVDNTDASKLVLMSDNVNGTGYLRINPSSSNNAPYATVQMFCKAYYDLSGGYGNDAPWQYIGSPVQVSANAQDIFYLSWLYGWSEASGEWTSVGGHDKLSPFVGYALTQPNNASGQVFEYSGRLVAAANKTVTLSYTSSSTYAGWNQIANSFVAPIDLSKLPKTNFVNCDASVYVYNTGSYAEWESGHSSFGTGSTAGQYMAIPVQSASQMAYYTLKVLPAMQGFFVQATAANPSVTIDYTKAVWGGDYTSYPNQPMRAPRRAKKSLDDDEQTLLDSLGLTARVEMSVVGDGRQDNLYLLQADNYTASYDNGCDAQKMFGEDNLPALYTNETDGQMAVCATNNLLGTYIGFRAPQMNKDTVLTYELHFFNTLGSRFVLTDLVTNQDIVMNEGASYSFQVKAGEQNNIRFVVKKVYEGEVPTSLDALGAANHMIQCGSVLYASDATGAQQTLSIFDVQGKLVDTRVFVSTTSYDLSLLPRGVYFARMADQTLKIVY